MIDTIESSPAVKNRFKNRPISEIDIIKRQNEAFVTKQASILNP